MPTPPVDGASEPPPKEVRRLTTNEVDALQCEQGEDNLIWIPAADHDAVVNTFEDLVLSPRCPLCAEPVAMACPRGHWSTLGSPFRTKVQEYIKKIHKDSDGANAYAYGWDSACNDIWMFIDAMGKPNQWKEKESDAR